MGDVVVEEGEGDGDDALVRAARTGDRDAWERLYRRLYPRLAVYASRRVGATDADDIVNETMSRAVAGIDRFEPGPSGFDGWVFGIARRVVADHRRRLRRFQRTDGFQPGDTEALPGDALDLADDHQVIRAALERLSPGERELLELRVIGGLTAEQTAAVLGRRPGAVRTAQSRALSHLRRLLGEAP